MTTVLYMFNRSVHPRACGEHFTATGTGAATGGSSPRVRGTRGRCRSPTKRARFIPARAGNTRNPPTARKAPGVHPRACGEHLGGKHAPDAAGGSSPRVRGTRHLDLMATRAGRFIPARAGNTHPSAPKRRFNLVHPRACGEHKPAAMPTWAFSGSSPRVRGTPAETPPASCRVRFIPARAGNTGTTTVPTEAISVHPRACGEHAASGQNHSGMAGSSPRVRGTPDPSTAAGEVARFIPARAGNTRSMSR